MVRFCRVVAAAVLALISGAANATCTLPNILTNGTLADANQVMADFNAIITCVFGPSLAITKLSIGGAALGTNALAMTGTFSNNNSVTDPSGELIMSLNQTSYNLSAGNNANDVLALQGLMIINPGTHHLTSQHSSGLLGYAYGAPASWGGTVDFASGVIGGAGNLTIGLGAVTTASSFLARPVFTTGSVTNYYAFYDQNAIVCGATNCYGASFSNPVVIGNPPNPPAVGYFLDVTGGERLFRAYTSANSLREGFSGLTTYTLTAGSANDGFGQHGDFSIVPATFTSTSSLSAGYYSVAYGNGAGTVGEINGYAARAGNQGAGTVTIAASYLSGTPINSGGGTLANFYDFKGSGSCGGVATNCYGLSVFNNSGFNTASPSTLVDVNGTFRVTQASPLAADACSAGQIVADTGFLYTCSSTGVWKRVAVTGGY